MANPHNSSAHSGQLGIIQIGQVNLLKSPSLASIYYLTGYDSQDVPIYAQVTQASQFDKNTAPSTHLNLSSLCASALANPISQYGIGFTNSLEAGSIAWNQGGGNWETFTSYISNRIYWLWGSLRGGGLGLCYVTGEGYILIATYGTYTSNITGDERICCYRSNAISLTQLSDCMIYYYYIENTDEDWGILQLGTKISNIVCQKATYNHFNPTTIEHEPAGIVYGTIEVSSFEGLWSNVYTPCGIFGYYPQTVVFGNTFSNPFGGGIDICPYIRTLSLSEDYVLNGSFDSDEVDLVNPDGGITSTGGGDGNFDNSVSGGDMSDVDSFGTDAINSGFITIYNPTSANVQAFTDFLFTGITEDVSIVLKRLISNPLDYVISMNMIHFHPRTSGSQEIKFCGIGTNVTAQKVSKQYQSVDCGSIEVGDIFNTFLDYGGFSKCSIYLPYCGIYPLAINDIMGGTIHCKYSIDLLTGACIAQLGITRNRDYVYKDPSLNDKVLYEFTGNVFSQVPVSAVDYRGTIQGLMQIASGVSQVSMGSAGGLGAIASGVMNLTPNVVHSGNSSTSFGYMGVQTPYLILERPMQNMPADFGKKEGYPSNIFVNRLNDLKGYTEIDIESFHTEYLNCTNEERDEIINLLAGGFII